MKVKVVLSKIIDTDSEDGSLWGIEEWLDDMPTPMNPSDCLRELFDEDILSLIEDITWDITIEPGGVKP